MNWNVRLYSHVQDSLHLFLLCGLCDLQGIHEHMKDSLCGGRGRTSQPVVISRVVHSSTWVDAVNIGHFG